MDAEEDRLKAGAGGPVPGMLARKSLEQGDANRKVVAVLGQPDAELTGPGIGERSSNING
jgi:hypothetical protein